MKMGSLMYIKHILHTFISSARVVREIRRQHKYFPFLNEKFGENWNYITKKPNKRLHKVIFKKNDIFFATIHIY